MTFFRRPWTSIEIEILHWCYHDSVTADIARALCRPVEQVYAMANGLGLRKAPEYFQSQQAAYRERGLVNGRLHGFPKGHVPKNKGLKRPKGWFVGRMRETQFKKGQMPHTWMPVGSYRVIDGYLAKKTSETPGAYTLRWALVHRMVWEAAHGPIPKGLYVRFRPGRKTTVLEEITVDALELITQRENMKRNSVHNLPKPLAKLVQLRGALNRSINRRERRDHQ